MTDSIIIFLIIFFTSFILVFILGYLPSIIRRYRIKKLGNEFNLVFDDGIDKDIFAADRSYKKNFLKGSIGAHQIEMYDLFNYNTSNLDINADYFTRCTLILVDGQKQVLKGVPLCFPSIRRLHSVLSKIKTQ